MNKKKQKLPPFDGLNKLMRYRILEMTTRAGSGHPTSSLSAVELMSALFFGGFFRCDVKDFEAAKNDRLIFSKGHASPLFYALWSVAGVVKSKELLTFRQFESRLEGHPTRNFPYTEVPTGSLGQGLGVGLGMAIAAKYLDRGLNYTDKDAQLQNENIPKVYVLLGDSELSEGSIWEAAAVAAYYKLDNLVAIVDVNRLGQRGETMLGHDTESYARRFESFGWEAIVLDDGHNMQDILKSYAYISTRRNTRGKPIVLIAQTYKGRGISFLENQEFWHGKALQQDEFAQAIGELGEIDFGLTGEMSKPNAQQKKKFQQKSLSNENQNVLYLGKKVAPRKVYGDALIEQAISNKSIVVLDAEVGNSTFAIDFAKVFPERFFEMFIAEQNMVSVAVGLSRRGYVPCISSFGAFLSRAFDQVRMAQYAQVPLVITGSHVGVSIGDDGASQMALEDIALFRSVQNAVILYPADAVAMKKLLEVATGKAEGITYIRSTRADLPVIYKEKEHFRIGGSKVIYASAQDVVTIFAAGITLHESIKAYAILQKKNIAVRIIDLYSIKPIDRRTVLTALRETKSLVVVEDHYREGGMFSAVCEIVASEGAPIPVHSLAVTKMPRSGTPEELMRYEKIDAGAIVRKVVTILSAK